MEITDIKLPLPPEVSRCLGHSTTFGHLCERDSTCARHITMRHPMEPLDLPHEKINYFMCGDNNFGCYLPLTLDQA